MSKKVKNRKIEEYDSFAIWQSVFSDP